jgi:hypothetical protein
LCELLEAIEENDLNYEKRYRFIFHALVDALYLGYPGGVRVDPNDPEWSVVYIELPTGQVSWRVPQHVKPWDYHSTEEKYERIHRYREYAQELPRER